MFLERMDERMKQKRNVFLDCVCECLGSFLIAVAMYNFAVQAEFPMTGFSGISMILYRLWKLPIGVTTIVLNIPVALLCWKWIGRGFLFRSLRCMLISSLMIDYLAPLLPVYNGDRMLMALTTGVLGGLGYAIVYMRNSSTGGSDFIIMAVKVHRPYLKLGTITFLSDVGIILAGGILFRDMDGIIYGMIINALFALVVDKVMYGLNAGKVALIVTEQGQRVCDAVDRCCGRGSTILNAKGGYKGDDKQVVMVACSSKEMYQVEQAAKGAAEDVFMIVMESNEVHGEGFHITSIASEKQ